MEGCLSEGRLSNNFPDRVSTNSSWRLFRVFGVGDTYSRIHGIGTCWTWVGKKLPRLNLVHD